VEYYAATNLTEDLPLQEATTPSAFQ